MQSPNNLPANYIYLPKKKKKWKQFSPFLEPGASRPLACFGNCAGTELSSLEFDLGRGLLLAEEGGSCAMGGTRKRGFGNMYI